MAATPDLKSGCASVTDSTNSSDLSLPPNKVSSVKEKAYLYVISGNFEHVKFSNEVAEALGKRPWRSW